MGYEMNKVLNGTEAATLGMIGLYATHPIFSRMMRVGQPVELGGLDGLIPKTNADAVNLYKIACMLCIP